MGASSLEGRNLLELLPVEVFKLLRGIGAFGSVGGYSSYLVGGPVRDLLLGLPDIADIDIMLHGDALGFVEALAKSWSTLFPNLPAPGKPLLFKKFGTAKLKFTPPILGKLDSLDFSGARRESYASPAAQPIIYPGSLQEDLERRDFSVNAMAISLSLSNFGAIEDLLGGRSDLQAGILRVLHGQSFVDDPARLIRGVRLSMRLSLRFDKVTQALFDEAVTENYLRRLPAFRRFDEFRKALVEERAEDILLELVARGLVKQIHPKFEFTENHEKVIKRSQDLSSGSEIPLWLHRILALAFKLSRDELDTYLKEGRVAFPLRERLLELNELLK